MCELERIHPSQYMQICWLTLRHWYFNKRESNYLFVSKRAEPGLLLHISQCVCTTLVGLLADLPSTYIFYILLKSALWFARELQLLASCCHCFIFFLRILLCNHPYLYGSCHMFLDTSGYIGSTPFSGGSVVENLICCKLI